MNLTARLQKAEARHAANTGRVSAQMSPALQLARAAGMADQHARHPGNLRCARVAHLLALAAGRRSALDIA